MDIFSLPPIIVEKVGLEEILVLLRSRINKSYMPSATGEVNFNSKPEYTRHRLKNHPEIPSFYRYSSSLENYAEYVAALDDLGWSKEKDPIYLYLWIDKFIIIINLQTEKTLIGTFGNDYEDLVQWDQPDQKIPVMRDALKELIDNYL